MENHTHFPHYSVEASRYLNEKFKEINELEKNINHSKEDEIEFLNNFDGYKAVEQDSYVWDNIISFLRR